jgi:tetratricopeptide (TPR) repeat protein
VKIPRDKSTTNTYSTLILFFSAISTNLTSLFLYSLHNSRHDPHTASIFNLVDRVLFYTYILSFEAVAYIFIVMESYPGELLVGVFPLVFCVDATLQNKQLNNNDEETKTNRRSQFDKFLDAIAASSSTDDNDSDSPLMRKVEEEQSDNEDELLLSGGAAVTNISRRVSNRSEGDVAAYSPEKGNHRGRRFSGARLSPFPLKRIGRNNSRKSRNKKNANDDKTITTASGGSDNFSITSTANVTTNIGINISPSFAEALQQGQSFFQRARIVSTSTRHGFPPSKDPTGKSNRVIAITGERGGSTTVEVMQQQRHNRLQASRLISANRKRPIDGILPSGWLEKHAAALPSVILVVTQIHHQQQQNSQQDDLLLEAIENLQYSLAPKRRVDVKVVALVQEGVSSIIADQWSQGIIDRLPSFVTNKDGAVTLVHERELQLDDRSAAAAVGAGAGVGSDKNITANAAVPRLHKTIQRSSLRYYKDRSREVKNKLLRLGPARRSPILLPLSIRYCFKAAVFYEFQWKQEKSLKYMVEAYRLVETYYRYLLQQREVAQDDDDGGDEYSEDDDDDDEGDDELPVIPDISASQNKYNEEVGGGEEGVELSLTTATTASSKDRGVSSEDSDSFLYHGGGPPPSEDMIYQCRAIADWLNFKILQSGLVSNTKGGLVAASVQWQRHAQAFCCPRRSFIRTTIAPWLDWSYVAQQRIVFSQLLERYPARALGELGTSSKSSAAGGGGEFDEVLMRCCPWRTYEAAAEALLKAGYQIKLVSEEGLSTSGKDNNDRIRYVGGIDHEGFRPCFEEESKKNHQERALNCALRGIALYDKEVENFRKANDLIHWSRSGARLHYLAGGALLGLNRHSEATSHLEKSVKLCEGWNYLESLIQRLLIECYEKEENLAYDETGSVDESSRQVRTSFLLDSYFNAKLRYNEMIRALEKLTRLNGLSSDECIQWNRDCIDEADPTLPFSFTITFPNYTHATAGNKVKASVWLRSNMDYTVNVNRLSILSFFGPLSIPSVHLSSAKNANEVHNDGLTIQPNETIEFNTELTLPIDLNQNDIDGKTGNSSAVKNARPRTSGITAAAGTRFALEDEYVSKSGARSWSLRCLGGKPLHCEGINMVFYPVDTITATSTTSDENNNKVELTIKVKERKMQANTKRTTFEENNYISSAWKRPLSLPMSRGPRCLRLLPPSANMTVTNFTKELTNGKALEGTINRIVLKLKAAENETCANVMIRVKCSSVLTTDDGKKKRISVKDDDVSTENEDVEDKKNPRVRTPVLVKQDASSKTLATDFGYILPYGWALDGDGQDGNDEYTMVVPMLKAGAATYAYFDLYRPTSEPIRIEGREEDITKEMIESDNYNCQTKVNLSIRYDPKKIGDDAAPEIDDHVSLDHNVTVLWSSPISVAFSSNSRDAYPSGNRHPSNSVAMKTPYPTPEKELILIDKEQMLTKGVIEAAASLDGLNVEIDQVRFTDNESENPHCGFKLISGHGDDGTLYKGETNNPCRTLSIGSKISFAWMAEVTMEDAYREERLAASLGTISINWQPSSMELPEEVKVMREDDVVGTHGPLKLHTPSTCHFRGPLCYIESAPFEAKSERLPDSIQVAIPFEVTYTIKNTTPLDQDVEMLLKDESNESFLISGIVNKRTSLGPYESHSFSYTAIPMRVGEVDLPAISISSKRYKTWVVNEASERRSIYVLP